MRVLLPRNKMQKHPKIPSKQAIVRFFRPILLFPQAISFETRNGRDSAAVFFINVYFLLPCPLPYYVNVSTATGHKWESITCMAKFIVLL